MGGFSFPARPSGTSYSVTVKAQPSNPLQDCVVEGGAGTIGGADINNIAVTCTTKTFAVGGTVTGLVGSGLVLTNNGGDDKTIGADGAFTFDTAVASGQPYLVAVKTSPSSPHQSCIVASGSGTVDAAAIATVTVTCTTDIYVDVTNGDNANEGSSIHPWKNVTYAIANAPAGPVDIFVAPGTYDNAAGETFPIQPKSGQNIVGDIANKGNGSTPTVLSGQGVAPNITGGDLVGGYYFGLFFTAGVTNAAVRGITVQVSGGEGIGFDDAQVTLEGVTGKGASDVANIVTHGSNVTYKDCDLQNGTWTVLVVDAATHLTMRGTKVSGGTTNGIVLGYTTAFTGSNVDLGTSARPGGNTILGGGGAGLLFQTSASGSVVQAVGNTWKANVQGADGAGVYASTFVDGSVTVSGNNYAISAASPGSGIQF